jgi:poly(beta-D-mannuronate) lyase
MASGKFRSARPAAGAFTAVAMVVLVFAPARAAPATESCVLIAPPSRALDVDGFYADRQGSVVDERRRAARDAAMAPYETFVRRVQALADGFALRGTEADGRCALRLLADWAGHGVLLGALPTRQAEYERNWYLAGLALAYLKVKPLAGASERAAVERWLAGIGDGAARAVDQGLIPPNNLHYWAGLALASAGLAAGRGDLEARGTAILRQGLAAIAPDGSLPAEMARGSKAMDYHAFAAAPLALLALIETRRARPFDPDGLDRLVRRIVRGLADPASFARQAGAAQAAPAAWNLAWLAIYRQLDPAMPLPPAASASHFLGGDVEASIAALQRAAAR